MTSIKEQIAQLEQLNSANMYLDDFLLTWDRSADEIAMSWAYSPKYPDLSLPDHLPDRFFQEKPLSQ